MATWLQIPRPSPSELAFEWREGPDGTLEVLSPPRPWQVYTLPAPDAHSQGASKWLEHAQHYGQVHGIPWHWIAGIIASESGGDPNAHNKTSSCYGLMQVNAGVARVGYGVEPGSALFDPDTNIDTACRIFSDHMRKTHDLPKLCSMYNAGPSPSTGLAKPSTKNPWRLVMNEDYIDHVVMYSNFFLRGYGLPGPAPKTPSSTSSTSSSGVLPAALLALFFYARSR